MTKLAKTLTIIVVYLSTSGAQAAFTPVGLSLVPPIQFPPEDFTIVGVRANLIYGKHRDVYGIDAGLVNRTMLTFTGVGLAAGANFTHGTTTALGMQLAGLANINTSVARVIGVQAALGLNKNDGTSWVAGLQFAGYNDTEHTTIYGVQAGIYNVAETVVGFQVGLVNKTNTLHGIQIGLINFNAKGPFVMCPIINIGF